MKKILLFFTKTFILLFGVKYLLPILFAHNFIISSICIFSIPTVLPNNLFIIYLISLDFITVSCKLNFFKSIEFKIINNAFTI